MCIRPIFKYFKKQKYTRCKFFPIAYDSKKVFTKGNTCYPVLLCCLKLNNLKQEKITHFCLCHSQANSNILKITDDF